MHWRVQLRRWIRAMQDRTQMRPSRCVPENVDLRRASNAMDRVSYPACRMNRRLFRLLTTASTTATAGAAHRPDTSFCLQFQVLHKAM